MKIALASKSEKKIDAVRLAFKDVAEDIDLITFKVPSGVYEQPVGDETLQGTSNRLNHIKEQCPDADIFISIENGIFIEGSGFFDRGVVITETSAGQTEITRSEEVEFPFAAVAKTSNSKGGFVKNTVGKTMAEDGIVKDHADPHLCLSGKSRVEYLNETMARAVKKLKL